MPHILVVDDYSVTQRVMGLILQQGGYTHIAAWNGIEALELLEAMPVDLVICDIAMPEMDGLELLSHLRSDPRYAHLPVIMLTASGQDEDRVLAESAGADGFLSKPASSGEILETVTQFLE